MVQGKLFLKVSTAIFFVSFFFFGFYNLSVAQKKEPPENKSTKTTEKLRRNAMIKKNAISLYIVVCLFEILVTTLMVRGTSVIFVRTA